MNRKILLVVLALMLIAGISPAFAGGARFGYTPVFVSSATVNYEVSAAGADTWVYGTKVYATGTNGSLGLYDVDSTADLLLSTTEPKDENGEATSGATNIDWLTKPIFFDEGVSVIITNANALIYTGGEPS